MPGHPRGGDYKCLTRAANRLGELLGSLSRSGNFLRVLSVSCLCRVALARPVQTSRSDGDGGMGRGVKGGRGAVC